MADKGQKKLEDYYFKVPSPVPSPPPPKVRRKSGIETDEDSTSSMPSPGTSSPGTSSMSILSPSPSISPIPPPSPSGSTGFDLIDLSGDDSETESEAGIPKSDKVKIRVTFPDNREEFYESDLKGVLNDIVLHTDEGEFVAERVDNLNDSSILEESGSDRNESTDGGADESGAEERDGDEGDPNDLSSWRKPTQLLIKDKNRHTKDSKLVSDLKSMYFDWLKEDSQKNKGYSEEDETKFKEFLGMKGTITIPDGYWKKQNKEERGKKVPRVWMQRRNEIKMVSDQIKINTYVRGMRNQWYILCDGQNKKICLWQTTNKKQHCIKHSEGVSEIGIALLKSKTEDHHFRAKFKPMPGDTDKRKFDLFTQTPAFHKHPSMNIVPGTFASGDQEKMSELFAQRMTSHYFSLMVSGSTRLKQKHINIALTRDELKEMIRGKAGGEFKCVELDPKVPLPALDPRLGEWGLEVDPCDQTGFTVYLIYHPLMAYVGQSSSVGRVDWGKLDQPRHNMSIFLKDQGIDRKEFEKDNGRVLLWTTKENNLMAESICTIALLLGYLLELPLNLPAVGGFSAFSSSEYIVLNKHFMNVLDVQGNFELVKQVFARLFKKKLVFQSA